VTDLLTDPDALAADPLRQFVQALPDKLRAILNLGPCCVAAVHTALRTTTPTELARIVAFGNPAHLYNANTVMCARLHRAAGDIEPGITNTDEPTGE
jgi:hypothetical protein